jgi:hypothetical protein
MHADYLRRARVFGAALIDRGDLDPLYAVAWEAGLDRGALARFLLGYSMFYHAGISAHLAETPSGRFYAEVEAGLEGTTWPRGTERRHYRGEAARNSLADLRRAGPPEKVWATMVPPEGATFGEVARRVRRFTGFGPWIAFKIADMADRSGWAPVDFRDCQLDLYRDPRKGAALVMWGDASRWQEAGQGVIREVAAAILAGLPGYRAPPMYDRPLNIQEAETIMCKFKGHVAGRYPVGKDVYEMMHALDGWGNLASAMRQCSLLPRVKEDGHV